MQVTWRGFGNIKKNSKQAQTERRWETQKPQLWRRKEEREEGEKQEEKEIGAEDEDEGRDWLSMLGC